MSYRCGVYKVGNVTFEVSFFPIYNPSHLTALNSYDGFISRREGYCPYIHNTTGLIPQKQVYNGN